MPSLAVESTTAEKDKDSDSAIVLDSSYSEDGAPRPPSPAGPGDSGQGGWRLGRSVSDVLRIPVQVSILITLLYVRPIIYGRTIYISLLVLSYSRSDLFIFLLELSIIIRIL